MTTMDRLAIAEAVAEALEATGEVTARVWESRPEYGYVRVYVARQLSRGRTQDMGYISVEEDGTVHAGGMVRRQSWAEGIAQQAVAAVR